MRKFIHLLLLMAVTAGFCACSETSEESNEFENWEARNTTFMLDTLAYANKAVAAAKAQWGDAWEEHCEWRVFPSFQNTTGGATTWKDSIAVRIIERGTGSGYPVATDSVRVTYAGRLIPSKSFENGYIFDHTGMGTTIEEIMDKNFEVSTNFQTMGVIEGWSTALFHMRIGDYWRVFIPANMGYGESGTSGIPGHSTLIFDMRLKAFYRVGSVPPVWN